MKKVLNKRPSFRNGSRKYAVVYKPICIFQILHYDKNAENMYIVHVRIYLRYEMKKSGFLLLKILVFTDTFRP